MKLANGTFRPVHDKPLGHMSDSLAVGTAVPDRLDLYAVNSTLNPQQLNGRIRFIKLLTDALNVDFIILSNSARLL